MTFPTLKSYRVSRNLSAKLRLVTLVAVTAVVFVHSYNMTSRLGSGENAPELHGSPGVAGFVEYLISQGLGRWPAALLFAISGFLFFHNLQPIWQDYRRKFAARLRTVVVPFLLWSGVGLLIYLVLQALPWSSTYFSSDFFATVSIGRLADKLLVNPIAYPLWFLQTLIVCFALAPLLYWPLRTLRWLAPLPFAVLWMLGVAASNWNDWKGLTFFMLGAVVALERRRGVRLTPPPWVGAVLVPIWVLACVLFTALLRDEDALWVHGLHKLLMCLAVASVWFGYDTYLRPLEGRRLVSLMLPFSFFIFVAQEPLLMTIQRVGLRILGEGTVARLAVYFGAAFMTVVIVCVAASLIRHYLPAPYAWLIGGRGGAAGRRATKERGRAPAPKPAAGATDLTGEPAMAETRAGSPST